MPLRQSICDFQLMLGPMCYQELLPLLILVIRFQLLDSKYKCPRTWRELGYYLYCFNITIQLVKQKTK